MVVASGERGNAVVAWLAAEITGRHDMTRMLSFPSRALLRTLMLSASVSALLLAFAVTQDVAARGDHDTVTFDLVPSPSIVKCLAQFPGDARRAPTADVKVTRGKLNDTLELHMHNIKPGLAFDLFTVQRSPLKADGTPDTAFPGFGFAWYQTDLEANAQGDGEVSIRTVLLDQIFGFDPDVKLGPTNTFHVGFWFNDPNAAKDCGFDPTKPTPFNGEHKAGPLAMISLPDAATALGPLCTKPNTSTNPASCNP